jgi:hypothetical protein
VGIFCPRPLGEDIGLSFAVSTIRWTVHLRLTTLAHAAEGFFSCLE